jgi:hypothetical protein
VQIAARVAARLAPGVPAESARIDRFLDLLRAQFGQLVSDASWLQLRAMLVAHVNSDRWLCRIYDGLLERLRPRLLLIEDGCYGHWGSLIRRARQHGTHIAEYQHGLVSSNHEAYNYLPQVHATVRDVLPDTFLAYGRYWQNQISIPSEVRVVGNPHLTRALETEPDLQQSASAAVMIVAGALDPAEYQRIAIEAAECMPDHWRVIVRPHPSRRASAPRDFALLAQRPRIQLDLTDNYYLALRDVDVVAGDASTAVMEAAAFNKRVFLIDHIEVQRNYPGMFATFRGGADLFGLISGQRTQPELPDTEHIWARDWQTSFRRFVTGVLERGGVR